MVGNRIKIQQTNYFPYTNSWYLYHRFLMLVVWSVSRWILTNNNNVVGPLI